MMRKTTAHPGQRGAETTAILRGVTIAEAMAVTRMAIPAAVETAARATTIDR
jgi:hypothetical protein